MNLRLALHPHSRLGHMEALEGARILERKLDIVANNMANVQTVGFKKQQLTFEESLLTQVDATTRNAKTETEWTDFRQGPLRETGNPMDFAIDGESFFVIQTPAGARYSRGGNFSLDAQNQLVTQEGYTVLGNGAPVVLEDTSGTGLWLSDDGRLFVDKTEAGSLDLVTFVNPQALERIGGNLFASTGDSGQDEPSEARIRQGYIEDSNVNPVETMIHLMNLFRAYEVQQKALQAVDQLDAKAISEVGKLA